MTGSTSSSLARASGPVSGRARRGLFLTLEGPEGAGKTTQARYLADELRRHGRTVTSVREPGGTPLGEKVRALLLDPGQEIDPRAEMLLFAASRAQLVRQIIRPALAAGGDVVSDRYVDASLAYQGAGRGLGADVVLAVNAAATDGLAPDLTLLLDIDVETGLARARSAVAGDRLERERMEFHRRVREGFLSLAQKEPHRIRVIDARRSVEDVRQAIREAVAQILRGRGEGPAGGGPDETDPRDRPG